MSGQTVTIGLAQRAPRSGAAKLQEFRADVLRTLAQHPELDVLAYPEMHLHDASQLPAAEQEAELLRLAVPLRSDFVTVLGEIAREAGIWLIPGSIGERADTGYFNTELLFAPDGSLKASYRKMFPWRPHEPHDYGTEFTVHRVTGKAAPVTLGLSNCYDAWFPEHTRQLAWLGAQAVVNVVRTTGSDRAQELILAQANAIVNQVYMFSVNCAAPVGAGGSIIVDPQGRVLAQADTAETTLVAQFDAAYFADVREHGTCGTNRMWEQFVDPDRRRPEIKLPLYQGKIVPEQWRPRG